MEKASSSRGPAVYTNWRAESAGRPILNAAEFPLWTDAHITGMEAEGYGPYQFFNTVPLTTAYASLRPSIVVRFSNHEPYELPVWEATDDRAFHGGFLADEVAALVSLCLGARIKAGSYSRDFGNRLDHPGLPTAHGTAPEPILLRTVRRPILPLAHQTKSLTAIAILKSVPHLSEDDAVELVRAARLYQQAIWVAESDPNQAWILLCSAVETAANRWREADDSPLLRLRNWKPELVQLLEQHCSNDVCGQVAEMIAHLSGPTKKFIDFVIEFLPNEPENRPPVHGQHSWSKRKMKKSLDRIYAFRSGALHAGKPFPAPICDAPMELPLGHHYERPPGASGVGRHIWIPDDLPMYLHLFEYIVRGALLRWWQSRAQVSPDTRNGSANVST